MNEHERAVKRYLNSKDYLSKSDLLYVAMLNLARELDDHWRTQAYAELLRTYRLIESTNPNKGDSEEDDDLFTSNR